MDRIRKGGTRITWPVVLTALAVLFVVLASYVTCYGGRRTMPEPARPRPPGPPLTLHG